MNRRRFLALLLGAPLAGRALVRGIESVPTPAATLPWSGNPAWGVADGLGLTWSSPPVVDLSHVHLYDDRSLLRGRRHLGASLDDPLIMPGEARRGADHHPVEAAIHYDSAQPSIYRFGPEGWKRVTIL